MYTFIPKPVVGPADNEIWYTYTEEAIVPNNFSGFGANVVNNTYEDGKGIITFDGPVTSIGEKVFWDYYMFTSVTIPNRVTSIGEAAFYRCGLISITIPNSVTSIGIAAFAQCPLTSITFEGTMEQWNVIVKMDSWNGSCPEITVHCTDGDITIPATINF